MDINGSFTAPMILDFKILLKEYWLYLIIYLLLHLPLLYIPFFSVWDLIINIVGFEIWLTSLFLVIATMRYKIEKKFEFKIKDIKKHYPVIIKDLEESDL